MIEYGGKRYGFRCYRHCSGSTRPRSEKRYRKGVATLFDIPVSSVMVFEKNQEENENENKQQE